MTLAAWMADVRRGMVVWTTIASLAWADPPPDFFNDPGPGRAAAAAPHRARHVASYGKAYDRAYATKDGEWLVKRRREEIERLQAIEDRRAAAERRRPRDLAQEVRGGMFALHPDWESILDCRDPTPGPVHFCMRFSSWDGDGWRGVAKAVEAWRRAKRRDGELARRTDAELKEHLRGWYGDPCESPCHDDDRRLAPVELDACIRAYSALTARGQGISPWLSPARFAEAMRRRNEWFPPVVHRMDGAAHRLARRILDAQLAAAGAGEEERELARRRFDDHYAALPDRPPVQALALRSSRDRLVERAQRRENEAAVCEGRVEVDVAWALERGRLFRPDLVHSWVVHVPLPLEGTVADGDCFAVRPTLGEAEAEIGALRELCRWAHLDEPTVDTIVEVRRAAWASMPERLPAVAVALLDRQPVGEELDAIVAAASRVEPRVERVRLFAPPPEDRGGTDRIAAAARRADACRAHYTGRGIDPRQSEPDVRAAARRNYRAMLAAERHGDDEIERRLAAWDALAP